METPLVVSLDTAAVLMSVSKRTLWRYLRDGKLTQHPKDAMGRVMLSLEEISTRFCVELSVGDGSPGSNDYEMLALAEQGDQSARTDFALRLLELDRPGLALHWLQQAANEQYADAMHHLSRLYQQGQGVEQCADTALVWRSKAAVLGHGIARAQLSAMQRMH